HDSTSIFASFSSFYSLFFFSSRRRHTRSTRDWSSDVCSSDLRQMADFDPGKVARQIGPLQNMLEKRSQLADLRGRLQFHQRLERSEERRVGKECRSRGSRYR